MSDLAVRVEGLGKEYRLGGPREQFSTLRDRLDNWASAPFRAWCGRTTRPEQNPPFWALKDVSFAVKRGDVIGVIGRNGAGKDTLLKILSRITEPTLGEVDMDGRVGSLLEVGTGFHHELSGRENVYLNGAILGMRRAEIARKFDEIVAFAELAKFIDTPVKHYSSGMYMRLAFAVAAHLEPEILIVDEVLAVGDVTFQKKCLGRMKSIGTQGTTVLFVSHNMPALTSLCEKTLWLESGSVKDLGNTADVINQYLRTQSGADQAVGTIDLRFTQRPRKLAQAVKFRTIELQDCDRRTSYTFGVGEPIRVVLTLESAVHFEHFVVGFSIKTHDGSFLCTSASVVAGQYFTIQPGALRFESVIDPNYLKPGVDYLQVGNEVVDTQDLIEEAVRFEITPTKRLTRTALYNLPGVVHFDYPWCRVD